MQRWITSALDLFFPRLCAGCEGELGADDHHLCWDCRCSIQIITNPFCEVCGNPLQGRIDHGYTCYECAQERPYFDCARCAARFDGVVEKMIHAFKYHQALWLEDDLTELLLACCETHFGTSGIEVVASVPLFPARERTRGYNQAALLGAALAKRLRRPFCDRLVRRVRDTQTQTHLTASERASNVRAAFSVARADGAFGRRVLLVDDVMTTGATVNECSRALKEAGAREVLVVTLARGG